MKIVLPSVATLEGKVAKEVPGSERHVRLLALLERSRRASARGPEGASAEVGAVAGAVPRSHRHASAPPPPAAAPAAAAAAQLPSPPSLRAAAAGLKGKDVLARVQRAALRVALKLVERARAAKARASPLERQRRVCDAWLRVMAAVRELPPFHHRFRDGTALPRDYEYVQGGAPPDIARLWAARMPREERRREELRMAEVHYEDSSRAYWSSFSARRVDGVREELEEAAASPNGFMASAFKILRRTRPSACGNKARAPAPDLMSAIFEGGDDKDPSKLRTGAAGFREELLKQGNELYAARPSCGAAVEALLGRLEPVLRRHVRGEAGEGAAEAKAAGKQGDAVAAVGAAVAAAAGGARKPRWSLLWHAGASRWRLGDFFLTRKL